MFWCKKENVKTKPKIELKPRVGDVVSFHDVEILNNMMPFWCSDKGLEEFIRLSLSQIQQKTDILKSLECFLSYISKFKDNAYFVKSITYYKVDTFKKFYLSAKDLRNLNSLRIRDVKELTKSIIKDKKQRLKLLNRVIAKIKLKIKLIKEDRK